MKKIGQYILAAALAAAAVLPVSGASAMSVERMLTDDQKAGTFRQDSLEVCGADAHG